MVAHAFDLYHPRAGHPDWPQLFEAARAQADTLRPHLERPASRWARMRRQAASYRTFAGNYLTNRSRQQAGREDLRPLYFIWTMLRTCNFRCDYCDDHQGHAYPELSDEGVLDTAQAKRLLEVMRTGTSSVYFAGGEPTVRADLPELARHARDLDYYPIIINTNGSLIGQRLRRPSWKTWLADMDIIIVSLDALDLGLLRQMWRYRKSHEVLQNLLLLRELSAEMGFKLMVNTVIQPGRVAEARAVLDLANDLGIWFCPVPVNVGPTVKPGLLQDADYRALVEVILARQAAGHRITGSPRLVRRLLTGAPLDCRNTLKPHIDFDGQLVWPCKAAVNVSPEYVNVLDYADVDALYAAACQRIDPTRFHGPAKNQCGANCNWAQNYTTDAYAYGLQHPLRLLGDVVTFANR